MSNYPSVLPRSMGVRESSYELDGAVVLNAATATAAARSTTASRALRGLVPPDTPEKRGSRGDVGHSGDKDNTVAPMDVDGRDSDTSLVDGFTGAQSHFGRASRSHLVDGGSLQSTATQSLVVNPNDIESHSDDTVNVISITPETQASSPAGHEQAPRPPDAGELDPSLIALGAVAAVQSKSNLTDMQRIMSGTRITGLATPNTPRPANINRESEGIPPFEAVRRIESHQRDSPPPPPRRGGRLRRRSELTGRAPPGTNRAESSVPQKIGQVDPMIKSQMELLITDMKALCDKLVDETPLPASEKAKCNSETCQNGYANRADKRCKCYRCAAFREGLYSTADVENSVNCEDHTVQNPDPDCTCIACQCFREGLQRAPEERILAGEIAVHIKAVCMQALFKEDKVDERLKSVAAALCGDTPQHLERYFALGQDLQRLVNSCEQASFSDGHIQVRPRKKPTRIGKYRVRFMTIVVVPSVVFEDGTFLNGYAISTDQGFLGDAEKLRIRATYKQDKRVMRPPSVVKDDLNRIISTLHKLTDRLLIFDESPSRAPYQSSTQCRSGNAETFRRCRCWRCVAYREGLYYTCDLQNSVNCENEHSVGDPNPTCQCDACIAFREGRELAPPSRNVPSGVTAYLLALGMASFSRTSALSYGIKDRDRWNEFNPSMGWVIRVAASYFVADFRKWMAEATKLHMALWSLDAAVLDVDFGDGALESEDSSVTKWRVTSVPTIRILTEDGRCLQWEGKRTAVLYE